MQYNRVVQLSNGTCIKIDNALSSRVRSITFELEKDKKYEDHFSVYNEREQEIDGNAYSDNNRVILKSNVVTGKVCDVVFNVDTTYLDAGDEIKGSIFVMSNVGMLEVPYEYKIVASNVERTLNSLNTISDYYDAFVDDFELAMKLFTNSNLTKAPFMQDEFTMSLYLGLIKGSNSNIAVIEFFRAFEIDIIKLFDNVDDKIVRRYIDETLDNLDLNSIKDNDRFVNAVSYGGGFSEGSDGDSVNARMMDEAIELIDIIEDKELLNVLASMCVRSNFTNRVVFEIYLKVVENGSNISGIYDKFLFSIPEGYSYKLPLYIYRYYFDDTSYSFDDKSRLYENIIAVFEENDNVYKMYSSEMLEYAISRIYQNRITESLIKIYNKVLSTNIINENNCNNILYLLRSHKVLIYNRDIRKVIIRYAETEKETKYDVINGIAYVPIFFDSYLMFYEDLYGNRFYGEDADITNLFDRRDLEKYIIENYPRKEIIEMTKIIKLNEAENFTKEYEIDEIKDLEARIDINSIIRDKYEKKIINYYYNKKDELVDNINDMQIAYLKKIKVNNLTDEYKTKLLKVLLMVGEYQYVYDNIGKFGQEILNTSDLITLFSKLIDINVESSRDRLLSDILEFVKLGNLDPKLIMYLSNHFNGSVNNLVFIMDALNKLNIDSSFVAKKVLMIELECNDNTYLDHAFESFNEDDDLGLMVAYLNKKATDYFLDEVDTKDEYFKYLSDYMMKNYDQIEKDMPIIFLFAITKYVSNIKVLNDNVLRRLLIKSMERLLNTEYIFAYYKNINRHMRMPYSIMNKEYIEYHANKDFVPKAILTISGDEEKKEIELNKVFMNIYVKRITVFKNEIIKYDIINGTDATGGILSSGTLIYDENYELEYPKSNKVRSTFDYINDAIVCLDRENVDGLKRVVLEMVEKQEMSKELFMI